MPSIKPLVLLFTLIFFLNGCSGGGASDANNTLKINSVYTDIWHQHQSFYEKWGVSPNRTIRFTVSVNVTDPKGPDNLRELFFRDKVTQRYWSLLGGPYEVAKEACYYSDLDIYECMFYSEVSLNRINLKNWEIVAENKQGAVTSKDVEFLLPGGNVVDDELFVYSSKYSGSTQNGIAALEAMTIADNEITFSSNPDSQSFHIEFENTDNRATHYDFYFYDGTADINNIGGVSANSPSIVSTPIVQGQKTAIDIPWSEVTLYGNATIEDINGLHIKLLDEPVEWLHDGVWFNYISLSEFITLSP